MKRTLAVLAGLGAMGGAVVPLGCSESPSAPPDRTAAEEVIVPSINEPECPCICGFGLHCNWKLFPTVLAEGQPGTTFQVGFDAIDFRRDYQPWRWEPIDYMSFGLLYDPTAIELLAISRGIDNWLWNGQDNDGDGYVDGIFLWQDGPWWRDPSWNSIGCGGWGPEIVAPLLPPLSFPGWPEGLGDRYRFGIFTFRQLRRSGETIVRVDTGSHAPFRPLESRSDLKLFLRPDGPRVATIEGGWR
jgi:hypothetical protein